MATNAYQLFLHYVRAPTIKRVSDLRIGGMRMLEDYLANVPARVLSPAGISRRLQPPFAADLTQNAHRPDPASDPMEEDNSMPELVAIELKAHVPARDFEVSKQFYQDIGFTLCWSNAGLALLHYGPHGELGNPSFLLQDYYVKEFAENLQMHLLVKDVDAWWAQIQAKQVSQKYGVQIGPPEDRDWKMRDFVLFDPSGVLWRVAQDID
jgi:hypothetical protein